MKSIEEIIEDIKSRKEPLTADELINMREIVRVYGVKEFLRVLDGLGAEVFVKIFEPNMTLEIKKKQIMGRSKELIDFIKPLVDRLTDKDIKKIEERFHLSRSVDFIKKTNGITEE